MPQLKAPHMQAMPSTHFWGSVYMCMSLCLTGGRMRRGNSLASGHYMHMIVYMCKCVCLPVHMRLCGIHQLPPILNLEGLPRVHGVQAQGRDTGC